MPPEKTAESTATSASLEEIARARRHRRMIIGAMLVMILLPLGGIVWLLLR